MTPLAFNVMGLPTPQAGMQSVPAGRDPVTGRPRFRKITEGGKGLAGWRQDVSQRAAEAHAGQPCMAGPVLLEVVFRMPMPKSRPMWAKAGGVLLSTVKPDLDKLARAIGDSCTVAGVIRDDAQVAIIRVVKAEVWEAWTGASIRLTELDPRMSHAYVQGMLNAGGTP